MLFIRDGTKKCIHLTIAIFLFKILKSIFLIPESILIHIKNIINSLCFSDARLLF